MIDNKNRNQEEAKSIQVAEESRELDWKSKSFMASMFMGDLDMGLAFPFPIQSEEDRKEEIRQKELYIPQKDPADLIFDNGVTKMNEFLNKIQEFEIIT